MTQLELTQAEIDELISCRKTIVEPPSKQPKLLHGCWRNGCKLQSDDGRLFAMFQRQLVKFVENFSVGLRFLPDGEEALILLRANGPHGAFLDSASASPHWHAVCHVHRATEANLRAHRKSEAGGTPSSEFATFKEATLYVLREANIEWSHSHFPDLRQGELFDGS